MASNGFPKCLEIKLLYANDQDNKGAVKTESSYLLNQIFQIAKEHKASSLCVKVAAQANEMLQFFIDNQFKVIDHSKNASTLARLLSSSEPNSGKRVHRQMEEAVTPPDKKPKIEGLKPHLFPAPARVQHHNGHQHHDEKTVECPIMKKYFHMIQNGSKTIEGRINNGMFSRLQNGQKIRFKNGAEFVLCKITKLSSYPSFEELLKTEGVKPCLPDVRSLEEAVGIYNSIRDYPEKAKQHGVIAIHITRV